MRFRKRYLNGLRTRHQPTEEDKALVKQYQGESATQNMAAMLACCQSPVDKELFAWVKDAYGNETFFEKVARIAGSKEVVTLVLDEVSLRGKIDDGELMELLTCKTRQEALSVIQERYADIVAAAESGLTIG